MMRMMGLIVIGVVGLICVQPCFGLDDEHWQRANEAIGKGIAYVRSTQGDDGSWTANAGPGVTALVVATMLDQPDISTGDPVVSRALAYILSKCRDDGGIHDGILENYNTAICLSALARVNDQPEAAKAIRQAQAYLGGLQWDDQTDPQGQAVSQQHAYYGGAGYGKHGRPDLSNTQIMLEGLHESGLDCNDPVFVRAMTFITRCQGTAGNKMFGDRIVQDGGFIYSTSVNKDQIGQPQSKAGQEAVDDMDEAVVSRLRTYGSMTYAGFKSYLYANLSRDDPRVVDAYGWIKNNYTLDQNPGMPEAQKYQGLYYYYVTFARAMGAWGTTTIPTADGAGHDWANDLVDKLVSLQHEDGSWVNESDRWLEGDADLVTAYALTALTKAIR